MLRLICILALCCSVVGCNTRVSSSQPLTDVCGHIRDQDDKRECERRALTAIAQPQAGSQEAPAQAFGASWFSGITMVWYLLYYAVGLVFGIFVYKDAQRREWRTFHIPPFGWGAACLFEPALGSLAYWVLHYSRLARHSA
jgi:hypothetical protein